MKIIYYRKELEEEIKNLISSLGAAKIDLDYRAPLAPHQEVVGRKKPWWQFWSTKPPIEHPMGGIPVEGVPDTITIGITLVEHIRNLLIDAAVVYYFYEIIDKRKSKKLSVEESPDEEYILQIITDEYMAEFGEQNPHEKTISFLFRDGLTQKQFAEGYKKIPEIRKRVQNLLEISSSKNIDKIRCTFSGVDWDIDFVNRQRILDIRPDGSN